MLAADLVGYTRLMDAAEWDTYARVRALRIGLVDPLVVGFRGRIVKSTGDGFLATFASPADALGCALEIQAQARRHEAGREERERLRLRIGLNWGETITDELDVFGSAVNLAARLQQVAAPGGILISSALRDQLGHKLAVELDDLGLMSLRNLDRPVRVLAVRQAGDPAAAPAASHAAAVRRARLPSIAILPFRTLGGGDPYLGEGLVEDITGVLAGLKDLLVIARGSTLAYRGRRAGLERVGEQLGVRYVLSGAVRRAPGRLRLTVRLGDCETAAVLWSERLDLSESDLFEAQDRIAQRIAWTVAPQLRGAELRRLARRHPESWGAYELVLRAIDLIYRMHAADFARARPLLERAIELDDGYARAYAFAAKWHLFNVGQGWSADAERDSLEAGRLAAAAVQRDPTDALALAIQGHSEAFLLHRYDEAERLLERALAAGPGHALVWSLASGNAAYVGDAATATARAEWGQRLSPLDLHTFFYLSFLGIAHCAAGDLAEAAIWAGRTRALNPAFHANLRVLAATLAGLGRLAEAREVAAALLAAQPAFTLEAYRPRCPWRDPATRALFLERLAAAGLPR